VARLRPNPGASMSGMSLLEVSAREQDRRRLQYATPQVLSGLDVCS
jgi:hypothetical protein